MIKSSEACAKSELDLLYVPPTQIAVEGGRWVDIAPDGANYNRGTVRFKINSDNDNYFNLSQTELYMDVCFKLGDTEIDFNSETAEKIGPVNNLFHSIFSQIEIKFNGELVENTNNTYPYRAYIENLLGYNKESKDSLLRSELFIKDTPEYIDKVDIKAPTDNKYNKGLVARRDIFKKQPVQLRGRLHCDVFNINKYLLNKINVEIKLSRSKSAFACIGDSTSEKINIEISDCFLRVRK